MDQQQKRRGRPPQGLDRSITVRLPADQLAWLDRISEQDDRPVSQVLRRVIAAAMARPE